MQQVTWLTSIYHDWFLVAWDRFIFLLRAARSDRTLRSVVAALFLIDLAWMLYFGLAWTLNAAGVDKTLYEAEAFRLTAEGGWPETFNFLKTLALVLLLKRLAQSTRQPIYVAFALLFAWILMDDWLAIHERVGRWLSLGLEFPSFHGLRPRDLGELIVFASYGVFAVPLLLFGFARSDRKPRSDGLALLIPFGLLAGFAIVADQAYHLFHDSFFAADILLDIVEDGGEMIAMTLAVWAVAALVRIQGGDEPPRGPREPNDV